MTQSKKHVSSADRNHTSVLAVTSPSGVETRMVLNKKKCSRKILFVPAKCSEKLSNSIHSEEQTVLHTLDTHIARRHVTEQEKHNAAAVPIREGSIYIVLSANSLCLSMCIMN